MFKVEIQANLEKGLHIVTGRKIEFEPRIRNPGSIGIAAISGLVCFALTQLFKTRHESVQWTNCKPFDTSDL